MIRILTTVVFLLVGLSSNAQKPKAKTKSVSKTQSLAKAEGVQAILIEQTGPAVFYVVSGAGKTADSLLVKTVIDKSAEKLPKEVKLKKLSLKGAPLIYVGWTEKKTLGDAKTKLENIVETHSEIWDPATKSRVFENTQTVNNITEIVWLDANKTASKTVDKIRRDGFEFTLNPDGGISLKNKTQQESLSYDADQKKYIAAKTPAKKK